MSEHKVYIIPREQVVKIAETKRMILVPDKIPDHIHLVSADEHDYSQPGEWQPTQRIPHDSLFHSGGDKTTVQKDTQENVSKDTLPS